MNHYRWKTAWNIEKKSSKKINSMYHITSVFWHYILAKNATLTIKSDWRKLQRNRTVYIYVLFNNFQNSSCWRISASSLPISLSLRWAHTVRDNKWVLSPQSHLVSQYPHRRATSGPSHLPEPCFGRTARFSTRRNCTLSPSQCKRLWVSHLDLLPLLHSCRPSVTECFLPVVLWFWQDHPHVVCSHRDRLRAQPWCLALPSKLNMNSLSIYGVAIKLHNL